MKELNEHIESIITRKISGEISTDEQVILDDWLRSKKENETYYLSLVKIYSQATKTKSTQPIDVEFEWQKFRKATQSEINDNHTEISWFKTNLYKIAASFILLATIGYFLWAGLFQSNEIQLVAQTWGEVITLPDNSTITLNKGAIITYPKKFSDIDRQVSLNGEAFFEITRNEEKPFVVQLTESKVEVLGTSFNIDADIDRKEVEVVVSTGKVKFSSTVLSTEVILNKGEKGLLIKNTNMLTKSVNNDVNVLAWKTRKIVFNNMELDTVIKTINSLYDAQISFSTDMGANCNVTVSFENQSLEAVLSVLELTLGLEYTKSGDVIEITKTGC